MTWCISRMGLNVKWSSQRSVKDIGTRGRICGSTRQHEKKCVRAQGAWHFRLALGDLIAFRAMKNLHDCTTSRI